VAQMTYAEALAFARNDPVKLLAALASGQDNVGRTAGSVIRNSAGAELGTEANPFSTNPGIVTIVGLSGVLAPTITVSTAGAYAPGNVVGGKITLSGALRAANSTGILQSILVKDNANQKAPLTMLLFNDNPTATFTDRAACPDLTADMGKIIRKINIAAADYETIGTIAIADISAIAKMLVAGSASGDLWLVNVTTGSPTYGAASDLQIQLGVPQDY
jgi:hypothetical protein